MLVASHQRAWLHVFAATPSLVRLNSRTVQFLLEALSDLPMWRTDRAHRWTSDASGVASAQISA